MIIRAKKGISDPAAGNPQVFVCYEDFFFVSMLFPKTKKRW